MATTIMNYEINEDIHNQQSLFLQYFLIGATVIGYLGVVISINDKVEHLLPCAVFLTMTSLVGRLREKFYQLSARIFVLGLIASILYIIYTTEENIQIYFLMGLPIMISMVLLNREEAIVPIGLALAGMYGISASESNLVFALRTISLPLGFCALIAAITYIMSDSYQQFVYWAIDSQKKNQRRAGIFYEQREQLKETLLELQHAHERLERLNVEKEKAQKQAEEASNAKSVFLSNMSHELRTPLNTVIGYTSSMINMPEMYNHEPLPEIYSNDIELILANGQYLLGLINDILDLSKIEAGKLEMHEIAVDLIEIFKGVVSTATGLIRDKPVQLRPDFPANLPQVWADPLRVRQVLLNLMSNAIKFTESGSVTLSAYIQDNHICIAVTDTGIGIEEGAISRIFERFEQAKHDTDRKYGGTGLGLDISQRLIKMHGDQIKITSRLGVGSTFSFKLVLATNEQIEDSYSELQQSGDKGITIFEDQSLDLEFDMYLPKTILLVEDDSDTRQMFRRVLEGADYVVVDAPDGNQVMDLATGILPDLIILDVFLPNKNGWDLLEALHNDPETRHIPTIILTVDTGRERAEELGAAKFIQKPIQAEKLVQHVRELLPQHVLE